MGNQHPSIAPYELLSCADGDLVLAVGDDRQFAALCDVLGVPHMAIDPLFATTGARVQHRGLLHAELEKRLATRTAADWAAELTRVRVPGGIVNDIAGAFGLAAPLGLNPIVSSPVMTAAVSLCAVTPSTCRRPGQLPIGTPAAARHEGELIPQSDRRIASPNFVARTGIEPAASRFHAIMSDCHPSCCLNRINGRKRGEPNQASPFCWAHLGGPFKPGP